jgi:hypothetical protein
MKVDKKQDNVASGREKGVVNGDQEGDEYQREPLVAVQFKARFKVQFARAPLVTC